MPVRREALPITDSPSGSREKAAQNNVGETLKLSKSPENRARIEKMKSLIDDYMSRTAREIITVQKEAIEIEAKRSANGELAADLEVRLAKLHSEEARLAREVGLPIARELEDLANKVVDFAKGRAEEDRAIAVQEMSSAEHNSLAIGAAVALVLVATCVFSALTLNSSTAPAMSRNSRSRPNRRRATKPRPRSSRTRSPPSSARPT